MNQANVHSTGTGRGSLKSYTLGFIFSILLTVVAFAFVMYGSGIPYRIILLFIFSAAIVQMLVHLHYFLHLDRSSAARWNVMALLCSAVVIALFVIGSLWIMFDLNWRMM
ncbi:MAG: cytochrome o ubiquinol oxidase subunit IV [Desulfosarcinaceae bacterium]